MVEHTSICLLRYLKLEPISVNFPPIKELFFMRLQSHDRYFSISLLTTVEIINDQSLLFEPTSDEFDFEPIFSLLRLPVG